MLMEKFRLIVSDGRDQQHRRPPALCGNYFQPDEMTFEQLLALATEYARVVQFFKLNMAPEGHWQQFFSADETIFMASVLALDTNAMLARFDARLLATPDYADWFALDALRGLHGNYRDSLDSPLLVARALDVWMSTVSTLPGHGGQEVRQLLEGILCGLQREMRILAASAPDSFIGMHKVFGPQFLTLTGLRQWERPQAGPAAEAPAAFGASDIRHNFHTLTQAVRMLQNGIRALLPHSLHSESHDPAVSLLIGFIELFQQLQQRLNRFGDKRIDFYFERVLGMRAQPQKPDSAFLVIRPTAGARQIQIDAGTEFIAGVDADQHDIIYANEHAATLNDAHVAALHTLFFERQRSAMNQGRTAYGTTGCYARQVELLRLDSDENEHQKLTPVPLLGAPKPGEAMHGAGDARFGFALASKVLLMREGERSVRVLFQYRDPAPPSDPPAEPGAGDGQHPARAPRPRSHPIEDSLRAIVTQLQHDSRLGDEPASAVRMSDVFVKLLRGMFRVALTTADGWHDVGEYRPEYRGLNASLAEDCLAIEFMLPAGAPPITGYDPAVHGGGYGTELPVLRFAMTQNEYSYPYDILSQWFLQDIRIEVDVRAVRQLLLYNQIGQLSALSPFMPFGPLPAQGSYLIVGCEEILYKQLRDLSLDIEWSGLPPGLGGFAGYYRGYDVPLKSGDVRASLAVLADGKWVRAGADTSIFRYDVHPDGSPSNLTSSESCISLRPTVQYYKPVAAFPAAGGAPFSYSSASMNGLFKLTLEGPEGALGHQAYPALLSRVLTHNARMKKPQLMDPLPNPPYTPQIGRIALNYKAVATIDFEQKRWIGNQAQLDSFIHLHPMGHQTMFLGDTRTIPQIPVYDAAGNLFIGVEGKQLRGTLSLYFYLREDSLPNKQGDSGLAWSYLSGNRWRRFEANQILEDSTKAFMTSGIVLIRLPDDIDTDNTVMPAGMLWLRLSADHYVAHFCSLYAVYAQAIKVTWQAGQGKKPQAVLPAMRIAKSRSNIAGVDSIHQIRRSFDGKAAESALQFRVRASERLRHKNRALTAADFELLILEQFPQVYKVKCFPNLVPADDPMRRLRPGHILIVAIPHLNRNGHVNQRPTLSGHLIGEIEQYVRRYASPDAVISVENPVYELVQVRCTVKLASQLSSGHLSERINQALCDYLSPWNATGIGQHFGWTLRQHDVVSFLLDLDIVEEVSGVSLLQIAPVGERADLLYAMRDNAKHPNDKSIYPSYPWSIAVPMDQHWIVLDSKSNNKQPKPIGIDELRVGSTFIIPRGEPS
jgi:hypothetical protein